MYSSPSKFNTIKNSSISLLPNGPQHTHNEVAFISSNSYNHCTFLANIPATKLLSLAWPKKSERVNTKCQVWCKGETQNKVINKLFVALTYATPVNNHKRSFLRIMQNFIKCCCPNEESDLMRYLYTSNTLPWILSSSRSFETS